MAGLPVTTGPISVFLFVEYGADFASQAALGTLYAMPAIAATAVGYRIAVSLGSGWIVSQLVSQSGYVGMVLLLSVFKPGGAPVFLLSMLSIVVGLAAMRSTGSRALPAFSSNQVLVMRMVSTTALVLIITTLASFLGPTLSGLLSTVLILAGVLAATAHREHGSAGGLAVMRGMMQGQIAFLFFCSVVWGLLPVLGLSAYLLALAAAGLAGIGVNRWEKRAQS